MTVATGQASVKFLGDNADSVYGDTYASHALLGRRNFNWKSITH
jgi:hypothetical protein